MARLKSKQFKKTYATTVNQPQDGVWSGRGIAVPAAGGMLGGDDYKQKIGRGKIPYHHGNAGTPSQGADSTFSSYLARVNLGYEDYEDGPMFPEQEPELEDTYYGEIPIRSRKLPKDFKVLRPKTKGLKEMNVSDIDEKEIDDVIAFIRESLYPDYGSYHPPLPGGYEYRNVPVVVSKDSEESEFDVLDDYGDVAVAYKTDGGVTSYQDRNKLIKEEALRRIIRRDIAAIFESSVKKNRY